MPLEDGVQIRRFEDAHFLASCVVYLVLMRHFFSSVCLPAFVYQRFCITVWVLDRSMFILVSSGIAHIHMRAMR